MGDEFDIDASGGDVANSDVGAGSTPADAERTYTKAEVEAIIKKRLAGRKSERASATAAPTASSGGGSGAAPDLQSMMGTLVQAHLATVLGNMPAASAVA